MKNKRLVHIRVVREAEQLFAEAMSRAKANGKRRLQPGDIVRYYFHGSAGNPPEAVLLQGFDRVTLLRTQEPAVYLEHLDRWVFRNTCCIMPNDSRMPGIVERLDAKIAAKKKPVPA